MAKLNMSEISTNGNPFADEFGVGEEDFRTLDSIVDKPVDIIAVEPFENDKGPGVFVLFRMDGTYRYVCTHSVTLTSKLTSQAVRDVLAQEENYIECTFIKRKSTKSDRYVYDAI